jgi:hypothetical protein
VVVDDEDANLVLYGICVCHSEISVCSRVSGSSPIT